MPVRILTLSQGQAVTGRRFYHPLEAAKLLKAISKTSASGFLPPGEAQKATTEILRCLELIPASPATEPAMNTTPVVAARPVAELVSAARGVVGPKVPPAGAADAMVRLELAADIAAGVLEAQGVKVPVNPLNGVPSGILTGQPENQFDCTTIIGRRVLTDVVYERGRQDAQWGGPIHDDEHLPFEWFDFIGSQIDKAEKDGALNTVSDKARPRLVKIAALALAGIASIDRNADGGPGPAVNASPSPTPTPDPLGTAAGVLTSNEARQTIASGSGSAGVDYSAVLNGVEAELATASLDGLDKISGTRNRVKFVIQRHAGDMLALRRSLDRERHRADVLELDKARADLAAMPDDWTPARSAMSDKVDRLGKAVTCYTPPPAEQLGG